MHYNLRVEIERVRSEYITQIEVASVGRAGRRRLVSPTFEQAIEDLTAAHDELLGHVADYHNAGAPPVVAPEAKVKTAPKPKAPTTQTKGKSKSKPAKEAPRKFAAA